jgi:hypothetical protein
MRDTMSRRTLFVRLAATFGACLLPRWPFARANGSAADDIISQLRAPNIIDVTWDNPHRNIVADLERVNRHFIECVGYDSILR